GPVLYIHSVPTRRSSDLGGCVPSVDFICNPHAAEFESVAEWRRMIFAVSIYKPRQFMCVVDCAGNVEWQIERTRALLANVRFAADRKSTRLNSSHVKISY